MEDNSLQRILDPETITICTGCGRVFEPHSARWSRRDRITITEGPHAIKVEPEACEHCRHYASAYSATVPTVQQCPCCSLLPQEERNLQFTRWRITYRPSCLGEPLQIQQVMRLAEYDLLLSTGNHSYAANP